MSLYQHSGVSVESWVEMTNTVPMHYETDRRNNNATLFFGQGNDYVLVLHRDNLVRMVSLASQAIAALDAASPVDGSVGCPTTSAPTCPANGG